MKAMTAAASSADAVLRPGLLPGVAPQSDAERVPRPPIPPEVSDLEPSVYRFILKHSMKQQILLLLLTLSSFPFLYYSLDLPKTIVNRAIGGKHFPEQLLGFEFDQVPYLMILCAAFLALVFINGAFKYAINTFKGQIGERMLRRFRYSLYQRLLCFPLSYFHKNSSAQIIPMITVECEQLGGFIGDAFNLPLFQGGQLLTMILFMFMQDPILAAAAIALYPVQGYIIPNLQFKANSRIPYEQIVEQFQPSGMTDAKLLLAEPEQVMPLTGELSVANVSLDEDDKSRVVDAVSFTVQLDEHVAIIGQSGSGKSELALLLARLARPSSGRITVGGLDFAELPVAVIGRRIGYAAAMPYLFAGTLRDNLLLALRHIPLRPPEYDETLARERERQLYEARRSGNIDFDLQADWIDYRSAGVSGPAELTERIAEILRRLDFEEDIYGLGLRGRLDPAAQPELAQRLLEARRALEQRLVAEGITNLVETYDPERYNSNATVAENLLFGTPIGPTFELDALADNIHVRRVLDQLGLTDELVEAGRQVAATMTEMFAGLPPEHEFFEQFSFIGAHELPEFAAVLAAAESGGVGGLDRQQRDKLLSLPFKLIAARHRLGILEEGMQQRLLEARRAFRESLPDEARSQIEFFDPARYNAAASLQDNILFGKIAYGEADATVRVPQLLREVLDALSLRSAVMDVGLGYHVGTAGSRLSLAQRQRAAIARALLKRPDLLILNEATSGLDAPAQAKVAAGLREEMAGRGLIWVLHRASLARNFDRVLVMSGGKLQEQGRFEELDRKDSLTALLMAAE